MNIFTKAVLVLFIFLSSPGNAAAQSEDKLYIPLDIQSAYTKQTRSSDGKPGSKYWQNSADYFIETSFDPAGRLLTGKEKIKYYNNSPDSLEKIVIRLYQDFYMGHSARDFELTPEYLTDGVKILRVKVDNEEIDLKDRKKLSRSKTNMSITPAKKILPDTQVIIEIEWSFIVSAGAPIRMGSYDSTTSFIAYWYPQISVYDDISGWDEFNFGGEKEFYNDFNNYDIKITVRKGVGVWATGTLQNPDEVLTDTYYKRYINALNSDSIVQIIKKEDIGKEIFKTSNDKTIWHYRAENVTDFSFATSGHYLWDAVSLQPDPSSAGRSYIAAVYRETSEDFRNVAEIARDALLYFSNDLPGVPYPYPSLTVFNGSGGMEFPMMINDGSVQTFSEALRLTSHEAFHQYFPFYTGTNERKYAWMDEGFAVMIPFNFQEKHSNTIRQKAAEYYESFAGKELEVPIMTPSILVTGVWYRMASYNRPAFAFDILEGILGRDLFRKCLQEFISRWNGKHPIPYDLFNTFNEVSGQDLLWFWKSWFFERGYPDLGIKEVSYNEGKAFVTIEQIGSLPVNIHLKIRGGNYQQMEIIRDASIWKNKPGEVTIETEILFEPVKIELGNNFIPDVNDKNNTFEFKR